MTSLTANTANQATVTFDPNKILNFAKEEAVALKHDIRFRMATAQGEFNRAAGELKHEMYAEAEAAGEAALERKLLVVNIFITLATAGDEFAESVVSSVIGSILSPVLAEPKVGDAKSFAEEIVKINRLYQQGVISTMNRNGFSAEQLMQLHEIYDVQKTTFEAYKKQIRVLIEDMTKVRLLGFTCPKANICELEMGDGTKKVGLVVYARNKQKSTRVFHYVHDMLETFCKSHPFWLDVIFSELTINNGKQLKIGMTWCIAKLTGASKVCDCNVPYNDVNTNKLVAKGRQLLGVATGRNLIQGGRYLAKNGRHLGRTLAENDRQTHENSTAGADWDDAQIVKSPDASET